MQYDIYQIGYDSNWQVAIYDLVYTNIEANDTYEAAYICLGYKYNSEKVIKDYHIYELAPKSYLGFFIKGTKANDVIHVMNTIGKELKKEIAKQKTPTQLACQSKDVDPVTMRLMSASLPRHGNGDRCPTCHRKGVMRPRGALWCEKCNKLIGGI